MRGRLKIGYFADGPWSHRAFEKIRSNQKFEIKFIVPRIDTHDEKLQSFAQKYGIPFLTNVKVNSDRFFNIAAEYECDIFVSMSYNQIFREKIINLPKYKTINCHAGKLPFYRGRNIINWAIINGEKEFGITVHYVDTGIDTGDILNQRVFPISRADTYKTILELAYEECSNILYDTLVDIYNGKLDAIKQTSIHPVGFYCGPRGEGDEIINWDQSSEDIYNFIRALCEPGPKATTYIDGYPVKINCSYMLDHAPRYINTPGQIVGKTNEGFIVKTRDTVLVISEIETRGKLRIGSKLRPQGK